MTKFEPKGEDKLREDYQTIMEIKDEGEREEAFIEYGKKNEDFKGSLHEQKSKKNQYLIDNGIDPKTGKKTEEKKELDGKPIPKEEEEKKPLLTADTKAYLFGSNMQMNRTEVRHLEKVMGITGKSWEESLKDGLYKSWKNENDTLIKRQGSQLGASRGGGSAPAETEMGKKFSKNLPKEYLPKPEEK